MNKVYVKLSELPEAALKQIVAGKAKGKTVVNPQSCIEAMTEEFGLCGEGWKYEVVQDEVRVFDDKQIGVFMKVALYFKSGSAAASKWSAPVFGYGGEFIRKQYKSDFVVNDDAYKSCLADALANAMRFIGVGAKVYQENFDGDKYVKRQEELLAREYVLIDGDKCYVRLSRGFVDITTLDGVKLRKILGIDMYQRAKDAITNLLREREGN